MQHTFSQFPEVVLADATHKTNERLMSFYLLTAVDGNRETEITAAFIVVSEGEHLIRQIISCSRIRTHNGLKSSTGGKKSDYDSRGDRLLTQVFHVMCKVEAL